MAVESQPQREQPVTERIESKLTRPVVLEAMPVGHECTVRLRSCSVLIANEDLSIGGGRTRRSVHSEELGGKGLTFPVDGGPAALRSKGACRDAVRRMLKAALPRLMLHVGGRRTEEGQWDELVPAGLVEAIVAGAAGGGSFACHVWMRVDMTHVYDEAKALLLSCEAKATAVDGAVLRRASAGDAGGAAPCPICTEELANGDGVTELPGCSHAFHRGCILEWFHRAPTCPYCRRDMKQYLDPGAHAHMMVVAAIYAHARRRGGGGEEAPRGLAEDAVARRRRRDQVEARNLMVRRGLIVRRRRGPRAADARDALVESVFRGQGGALGM